MLKKVTLTNMNTKKSTDIIVDTDDDVKAVIGSGKAPNEMAKVHSIDGIDESIHRLSLPKPSMDDRVALFAGVARCLERNISTIKSFELQANRLKSPRYRGVVADISTQIAQGEKVSDAMAKHAELFGDAMLALVRAGEEAGQLPEVCNRIAKGQKKTLRIIKKLKSGMIYPAIVLFIGVIVIVVMSYTLVPSVSKLYGTFKAELPWATKGMMALSDILINKPWMLLFPAFGIYMLLKNWGKIMRIPKVQRFLIKVPTIGNIIRKSAAAVSFRCLAMLLEANVRVSTALHITAQSSPNIVYTEFFDAVAKHTEDGLALPESFLLESHRLGEEGRSIAGLMEISSETGSSTDMLDEVANDYEDDLDTIGNQIDKIIEPFTIVILGIMVGFLIYAIYSPIFNLGSVVLPKTKTPSSAPAK
jgi:type II secretory pathway component PulF